MSTIPLTITERAQDHFIRLLAQERVAEMALRIFVEAAGTKEAEVAIVFCPPGEQQQTDVLLQHSSFKAYLDAKSCKLLKDATIDYEDNPLGGQLLITAPFLKTPKPPSTAPLSERVQYILTMEVNPGLAEHKGAVQLVEVTPENVVVLQFAGGCHGCGMANMTLKHGIERTLQEYFPEIREVRDSTDHSAGKELIMFKKKSHVSNLTLFIRSFDDKREKMPAIIKELSSPSTKGYGQSLRPKLQLRPQQTPFSGIDHRDTMGDEE